MSMKLIVIFLQNQYTIGILAVMEQQKRRIQKVREKNLQKNKVNMNHQGDKTKLRPSFFAVSILVIRCCMYMCVGTSPQSSEHQKHGTNLFVLALSHSVTTIFDKIYYLSQWKPEEAQIISRGHVIHHLLLQSGVQAKHEALMRKHNAASIIIIKSRCYILGHYWQCNSN